MPESKQQQSSTLTAAVTFSQHNVRDAQKLRFGIFEIDLRNRELWRRGVKVKLQQKPFQVLYRLLQTPGELVTRMELAQLLWPELHVIFDGSLNTAVNALRRALNDPWRNPRFIETRPGIGYRFVAPVQRVDADGNGSSNAYQDYRKGRYFQNKMTEEDLRKSVAYFQSALNSDPGYAPAYAGLADTYTLFALLGLLPAAETRARSREFAEAALRIDRRLADAHLSIACVKKLHEWDWTGAEASYRRAIELNPNYARAHQLYASFLAAMNRREEATRSIRLALELDPTSLVASAEAAWILYLARDFQGAVEQSWKTLAMDPRFAPAQNTLGLAYEQLGMIEEAIVEFQNASVCSGAHPAARAALGHAYATAGSHREAAEVLAELERSSHNRYVSPYWLSILAAGLGEDARALAWLRQAHQDRDVWLVWLKVEPRFDQMRANLDFQQLELN
ncbi:MAG TPA: winged helix-turn-helix domain-containing protein [Bryobacteraceae bacterium]|nr:winged helix-turn-helix domain-containing protein [Bryobacteraceae bacterium]